MNIYISATETFEAGHTVADSVRCEHVHGHRWSVKATAVVHDILRTSDALESALRALVVEFDGFNLNTQMHSTLTRPVNVAAYVLDRLLSAGVAVVRVEVSDGRASGEVVREIR